MHGVTAMASTKRLQVFSLIYLLGTILDWVWLIGETSPSKNTQKWSDSAKSITLTEEIQKPLLITRSGVWPLMWVELLIYRSNMSNKTVSSWWSRNWCLKLGLGAPDLAFNSLGWTGLAFYSNKYLRIRWLVLRKSLETRGIRSNQV